MLIICSECGKEYSDQAKNCPYCGAKTSQNRYISNNTTIRNNNMGNTKASGCSIVFMIIIGLIFGFIGFKLFFGGLGQLGLDKNSMLSSFKEAWNSEFWDDDTNLKSNSYLPSSNTVYSLNNSSNTNNKNSNSNNNEYSQNQEENKRTYNINIRKVAKILTESIFEDNVYMGSKEVEKYALTVINYQTETNNSIVGGVKDGQEWVIVNMKFENMSDSTVIINKNDFKIVDGAERYGYKPWYEHLNTELDMMEVRTGQTATFSVRFVYYKDYEMYLRYYNIDFDPTGYGYIDIKLR